MLLALSFLVGLMDGLGLAMFMPLLEVVSNPEATNSQNMGKLAFIVEFLKSYGLRLDLTVVLLAMLVIFIAKGVFKFFENYYKVIIRMLFVRKLRYAMIGGLSNMRYEAFVKSDAGRIQNSLSGEVGQLAYAFVMYIGTLQAVSILTVYLVMAFLANAQFAILVIIGGFLTNLMYRSVYKITKKLSMSNVAVGHKFQGLLIQSVHYFKYLKATAKISDYAAKLKSYVREIEIIQKRMGFLNSILVSTREPMVMIVVIAVILIQVNLLGGNLASIILSLLFFYRSLNSLMNVQTSWNSFLQASGSITNAEDFIKDLNANREQIGTTGVKHFTNQIQVNNLSFSYVEGTNVLENLDVSIHKNETIAFVGESGSGKTTLMNIVAGLLDGYSGQIAIDDVAFRNADLKTLQNKIGYITQEPVIFSDSLYNNVTFWAPKTDENLRRFNDVLQKSALLEFVDSLPAKHESELGDNGIQISGGQKQRISIARELYKEVEILLLDEATSALDSETEKTIQQNIEDLKGKYTIVIVAHRLSTIKNVDRIVVLEKGKIEAIGNFNTLVNNNMRFKRMVELQEF